MAKKIGDEKVPKKIRFRDWEKFFAEAGLGQAPAIKRLQSLTERVLHETAAMMAESIPGTDVVAPTIPANCRELLSRDWGNK